MRKAQWTVLSVASWLAMLFFIWIDSSWNYCLDYDFSSATAWCVMNAEMYEPFIHVSFILGWVFLILMGMEK